MYKNSKPSSSAIKNTDRRKNKNSITKKSIMDRFNEISKNKWINLHKMTTFKEYNINRLRRCNSKFGVCLVVNSDDEVNMFLPARFNNMTDEEMKIIANGDYALVNNGRRGRFFALEVVKRSPKPGTPRILPSMPQLEANGVVKIFFPDAVKCFGVMLKYDG